MKGIPATKGTFENKFFLKVKKVYFKNPYLQKPP
jgi:hypothetical protein